ncbi:hypothetical protein BUALT_Bualt05G0111400 [Buddleja alternifolia]|uniref:Glutamine-dependent NAD(+) synthetase n=1 Tax=Buddleja alternifolia TaxID=168488 RepID=A0AAV6XIA7_9LAMI|nr:hypothetical protein BUALT_Bualt05G0111400 [Buddleja alternifolia]
MRLLKVATCNLNQWAMNFDCNMKNIKESISMAKESDAVIRLGPELEITGYGYEDHFLELDTVTHAWDCLKELLLDDWTDGILCSFGMPVIKGELRWFTAWKQKEHLEDFLLLGDISEALSQTTVPFGYGYIQFLDTVVAAEVCEELFSPMPPHAELALNGVEVFMNASGSHHQLRKLDLRLRAFIDGCSCIVVNGDVVAQSSPFSLKDVELTVAQVDLDAVASLRGSISSFQEQASCKPKVSSVAVPYKLCQSFKLQMSLSSPLKIQYHSPEEEIAFGPGCWLWDYLRRSGASGFLLPLSGGADSSSVAAIVGCMVKELIRDAYVPLEIANGDEEVKADAVRIGRYTDGQFPTDNKEFARRIFYTVFMGSENRVAASVSPLGGRNNVLDIRTFHRELYSSNATRSRAKVLAEEIGSWHLDVLIDGVVSALLSLFQTLTGKRRCYKVDGGSNIENLGLQNIQARIRMVLAFMLASLLPWVHNKPGFYLVLGSSNVDEGLRGYLTKDLRRFLRWAAVQLGFSSLAEIEAAPPTAELEPLDEGDMGMTYEELSVYGRMRKIFRCGPVSMFKSYSPEDNRFDLRQFLYNARWPYQFRKIDELVHQLDGDKVAITKAADEETSDGGMGVTESISKAKEAGVVVRLGPKIEFTGCSCQDNFLKKDTITHKSQFIEDEAFEEAGTAIRLDPVLEITGYGCEDHFLEEDRYHHPCIRN